MNGGFNVVNVALLTAGTILIYAGVKKKTPKEIFQELFMKNRETIKPQKR